MSIKQKSSFYYQIDNIILQGIPNNPYLGITISSDIKWDTNIDNIRKKASSTLLGLSRRNLHHCPAKTHMSAYNSLVRSTLEYGAIIWDPFLQSDIDKIKIIQRKALRFIKRDYRTRTPGCVLQMFSDLDLASLQQRRKERRLAFIFRIDNFDQTCTGSTLRVQTSANLIDRK